MTMHAVVNRVTILRLFVKSSATCFSILGPKSHLRYFDYLGNVLDASDLKHVSHVLKEDAGLSLNFDSMQKSKTKFLVKGISAADAHTAALRMARCQSLP